MLPLRSELAITLTACVSLVGCSLTVVDRGLASRSCINGGRRFENGLRQGLFVRARGVVLGTCKKSLGSRARRGSSGLGALRRLGLLRLGLRRTVRGVRRGGERGSVRRVGGRAQGRPNRVRGRRRGSLKAKTCDGLPDHTTSCAAFVGSTIRCAASKCEDGSFFASATCGGGACQAPHALECGAAGCDATRGCLGACTVDTECASGFRCESGKCIAKGARCSDDGLASLPGDGSQIEVRALSMPHRRSVRGELRHDGRVRRRLQLLSGQPHLRHRRARGRRRPGRVRVGVRRASDAYGSFVVALLGASWAGRRRRVRRL